MGTTQAAETEMKNVEFKLHAAIDFGTDGCGLAFAYNGEVTTYDKFKGNRKRTVKTKTHILLNDENEMAAFGNKAKSTYIELKSKERKTWKFFERFKMCLYENDMTHIDLMNADDDEKKIDKVDTSEVLTAANGYTLSTETVFVAAFKELQKLAKGYIPQITDDDINDNEIQWILTVPAIWSESAKDKMKKWIIKSGLVDEYIKDQCVIVYEPDCASLAIQKDNEIKCKFKYKDKYILVDAGGGTVDVACHEITANGHVEEILYPTGDKWGSCYIDDDYIKLLKNIFKKEWIDEFKEKEPGVYTEIIDNFQQAKSTFYDNSEATMHSVQLPFEFIQYLEEKCGSIKSTPEEKIKGFKKKISYYQKLFGNNNNKTGSKICTLVLVSKNDKKKYNDNLEYLEMDVSIWKCLFDAKVNKIIDHVHKCLKMNSLQNGCKYLCLVGGFSGSYYLQEKMINAFGLQSEYKLKLIIPQKPILAVVQGAAWMGITKNYIRARKLKYTYGIRMFFDTNTAKRCGITDEYIQNNITEDGRVRNCFKIIARKDERIAIKEIKTNLSYRITKTSLIPIMYSNNKNPKVATDGHELAVLTVPHPDTDNETITEFHFYGTTFTVYSYAKTTPDKKKMVKIKYV